MVINGRTVSLRLWTFILPKDEVQHCTFTVILGNIRTNIQSLSTSSNAVALVV
jgi:hypothetical protein